MTSDKKPNVVVYTTSTCPNCRILKELLKAKSIPFKEENMASPAALTELNMHSIFAMTAPVLRIEDKFYSNITENGKINIAKINDILHQHDT